MAETSVSNQERETPPSYERKSDPIESLFFGRRSSVPPPPDDADDDSWISTGDHIRYHHARWKEARVAKSLTVAILAVSLTGIGGLLVYHKLIMPEPVSLSSGTVALPDASGRALAQQPLDPAESVPEEAAPDPIEPPAPSELKIPAESAPASETAIDTEQSQRAAPSDSEAAPGAGGELVAQATVACCAKAEKLLARLAAQPGNAETLVELAGHYLEKGKNQEAEQVASRAVEANPSSSAGWIVLGAARDALRDRAGAREAYQRCADLGDGKYARECKNLLR